MKPNFSDVEILRLRYRRKPALDPAIVVGLADAACRFMGPDEALELSRNIAMALADGEEPVGPTIQTMIENRVKNFGLITRVRQCTSALASVWFAHSIEAL